MKTFLLTTAVILAAMSLSACKNHNTNGDNANGIAGEEPAAIVTVQETTTSTSETEGNNVNFKDFSGVKPDGSPVRLSDYVGNGNYAIVDFWASWCGPCRREMPNIKEIFDTYGPKGLCVVSVAVWDGDNSDSRRVIEELGMDWNHIFTGEDMTASETYGVEAIPHIIVFGPDGNILKRGLRGDDLKNYIKNLYK